MSRIKKYRDDITFYVNNAYELAKNVKAKNLDPKSEVEIPLAREISQRVEGLVSIMAPQILNSGISKRILELEKEFGKLDWRVCLTIAKEIAKQKFCKFDNEKFAMETGIRVGLAYATLGVVSAPLEGFIGITIKKRIDGKKYISCNFAGPIRAAGGTAGAVCVLLTDYVRKEMGYKKYDPTSIEIKRTYVELMDYNDRCVRLQYFPSEKEVEFLINNLGVEISGDPSEKLEVSNYKDLQRIETNRIRGGMCLIVGECLTQKAKKIVKNLKKWGEEFGLSGWNFMEKFLDVQKKAQAHEKEEEKNNNNF